jgi:peroxiredoxin
VDRQRPEDADESELIVQRRRRTRIYVVTLAAAILGLVVAGVFAATHKATLSVAPPATSIAAADRNAQPALVHAAAAVGFHPNVLPGIGKIEDKPASAAKQASTKDLLAVGTVAPDFSLQTPQGQTVSLRDYRGKATLVEFFATWCPHCDVEAPHLRKLYNALPRKSYGFVSVNVDGEDAPSVFAYHVYFGLPFPSLLDPSSDAGSFDSPGSPGRVTKAYGIQTFPAFYVLDRRGVIVWRSDGEQPDALLRQELKRAADA